MIEIKGKNKKQAGYIKIISVPEGEAPKWVREYWVGLELPYVEEAKTVRGGVSAKKVEGEFYCVDVREAIKTLINKSIEAAKWYTDHVPIDSLTYITFEKRCCKILPRKEANRGL